MHFKSKQLVKWGCLKGSKLVDIHDVLEEDFGIACVSDIFGKSKVIIKGVWPVPSFYDMLDSFFFSNNWTNKAGTQFNPFCLSISSRVYLRFSLYVGYLVANILKSSSSPIDECC